MSHATTRTRSGQNRTSLYQEITAKIIAELEAGCVPWVQPWGTATMKSLLALPGNAVSSRRYSGINVLVLWSAVAEHSFSGQGWLTFRQALGLGGHVRKGERGATVVYPNRFVPDEERRRAERDGSRTARWRAARCRLPVAASVSKWRRWRKSMAISSHGETPVF